MESRHGHSVLLNIMLSSFAGTLNMCVTNPLDTLRIRWQTTNSGSSSGCMAFGAKIVREEGLLRGLWRPGIVTNMALCSVTVGVRLGLYENVRDALVVFTGSKGPAAMFSAGLLSGALGYFAGAPLFLIKNRLMSEAGRVNLSGVLVTGARAGHRPLYSNGIDALTACVRNEGVFGLWRGAGLLVLRGAVLSSSQILGYDGTKTLAKSWGLAKDGPALHAVASVVATLSLTVCTMPVDVVLTRYQTAKTLGRSYNSAQNCAALLIRESGVFSLWRGAGPMLWRMLPSSIITFQIYEGLRWVAGIGFLE